MASIKISALTEKTTMVGTEEVLINDSGTSKKFSTQRFLDVKVAAETAKTAAELAETNVAADLVLTNADVVLAEADKVQTGLDRVATAADVVLAEADKVQTGSDRAAVAADLILTAADTVATAADLVATNQDTIDTAADVVTATAQAGIATTKASTATTQAGIATTQAGNASTSATAAGTSETNAGTSETNASSSASSATTAQAAAEAARDSALASFDSFDDRYLGQKTSAPTLDNDGNALAGGTLYFNSTSDAMFVYEGSSWVAAYASLSGALLQTNNLSDLNNAGTARTNLGLAALATLGSVAAGQIDANSVGASELNVTGNGTAGQYLGSDADGTMTWTSISADPTMGGDLSGTASNAQIVANAVTDTELNSAKLNGIETGATADQTNAQIKTAYEANANSNEFSDAEQTKLSGVATGANNYSLPSSVVHDTEKGSLHATDALRLSGHTVSLYKGDGTSESVTIPDNNTTYSVGDNGLTQKNFTSADNTKLDGIATSANNYAHPSHPGDDFSVDSGALTGATVISDIDINVTTDTSGHVTDANGTVSTRTLTLSDLGYSAPVSFPSGTVMVFYQASAPTSWTQVTTNNDKGLRVVSGTGGGTGGTHAFSSPPSTAHTHSFSDSSSTTSSAGAHSHTGASHTHSGASHTHSTPSHSHSHSLSAGSHTLSVSQMPSHNHSLSVKSGWGSSPGNVDRASGAQYSFNASTSSKGGSSSHSHSLAGSITSGGSGTSGSASGTTGAGGTGATSSASAHTHTVAVSGTSGSSTPTAFAPQYINVIVCSKD